MRHYARSTKEARTEKEDSTCESGFVNVELLFILNRIFTVTL